MIYNSTKCVFINEGISLEVQFEIILIIPGGQKEIFPMYGLLEAKPFNQPK